MPSYVSLFSGCGGLDLGFLAAGYQCEGAYDLDHAAVSTYNHNLGPRRATVADLSQGYLDTVNVKADAIIAGPPCQGFSTIGARNPRDIRNRLLLKPVEFAIAARVKVLLLENVRGALSGTNSQYWSHALLLLRQNGYTTATLHVTALSAGLPQIRRRIVLVAARAGFNPPQLAEPHEPQTLKSIINVAPGLPNHEPKPLDPASRAGRIARHIAPGQKLSNVRNGPTSIHTWDIPEVFGSVTAPERELLQNLLVLRRRQRTRTFGDADPVPYRRLRSRFGPSTGRLLASLANKGYVRPVDEDRYDLRGTFNGKFRRLHPDQPAHAVLTKFCDPSHFLHPYENRGFTIREAARIQGFPDSFQFLGSARHQATQVGNAVPVSVALMLAKWIRAELL